MIPLLLPLPRKLLKIPEKEIFWTASTFKFELSPTLSTELSPLSTIVDRAFVTPA